MAAFSKTKTGKLGFLTVILAVLSSLALGGSLFDAGTDFPDQGQSNRSFEVSNRSNVYSLNLSLEKPGGRTNMYNVTYEGNSTWNISLGLEEKGLYRYSFISDTGSFPENSSLGFSVPSYNKTLMNASRNLTVSNSSDGRFCSFRQSDQQTGETRDYTCEYENFQAYMMMGQISAYYSTGNDTYRNRSLRFATQDYGSSRERLTCSHSSGDFDCEDDNDGDTLTINSGTRQGSLIQALWRVYSITGNATVRELAENYTRGSAESCDVYGDTWSQSFNCSTDRGQGSMILGYWEAYSTTGNETYREIARNLSRTNRSSPRIARGLWKGYRLTGDENLSENASKMTRNYLFSCPGNCTEMELTDTFTATWQGYLSTGDYGYYRHAVDLVDSYGNKSCAPLGNDSRCSLPNQQGGLASSLWMSYRNQLDEKTGFRDPRISGSLSSGSVDLSVEMSGKLTQPMIQLPGRNTSCELDFFTRSCSLSPGELGGQKPQSYYFNSSETRFPLNGSFRMPTSFRNDDYRNHSQKMASRNPETYCSPWAADNDTACANELDQAFMIQGFNQFSSISTYSNYSRIRRYLAYGDWESSNCNAYGNDFNCSTPDYSISKASFIQGTLMETFYRLHIRTGDREALEIARNYSQGHAEDCDVWNGNFSCASSRGQASMIRGYWHAYRTTGNETYLEIMKNLSDESLNTSADPYLGSGLWRAYSITNNETYREKAENITDASSCEDCGAVNFTTAAMTFRDAYLYGNRSIDSFSQLVETGPEGATCNPLNNSYRCTAPREQGSLTAIYTDAFETIPVELNASFSLDAPDSVDKDSEFEATCESDNTVNETVLYGARLEFETGNGLEQLTNTTNNRTDLDFNETVNTTASFRATESGEEDIRCVMRTKNGFSPTKNVSVTVNSVEQPEDTDPSGDSGGSGGSTGGVSITPDTFDPYRLNYSFQDTDEPEANISDLTEKVPEMRNECFEGYRTVYRDNATLELENSCQGEMMVLEQLPDDVDADSEGVVGNYSYYRADPGEDLSVFYEGSADREDWRTPIPLILNEKEKPIDLNLSRLEVNSSAGNAELQVELNRAADCQLSSETGVKTFSNTTLIDTDIDLRPGNNTITLSCGDESRSFTATMERQQEEEEGFPFLKLISVFIALIMVSAPIYKRELVISAGRQLVVRYYTDRFFTHLDNGEPAKAVESYEKLREYSESRTAQEIIGSETDLDTGIYLYLSLDAIKQAREEGIELHNSDQIIQNAIDFAENNLSKDISFKIERKLEEVVKDQ